MKKNNPAPAKWGTAIAAVTVAIFALCGSAYCQPNPDDVVLFIQQTPDNGGTVNPGVGVLRFGPNSEVALTAVSNPGYQFVYWLGDVSDTTSNRTVVYLDAPKIIIAVFARARYEFLAQEEGTQSAPVGGMYSSAADYSNQGFGGGGGSQGTSGGEPSTPPKQEEKPKDFPVPQEGNDFPVPKPIPEPATAVLLAAGMLMTFAQHKTQRIILQKQSNNNANR